MSPDAIPRHIVDTSLRVNLPFFAIACIALVFGISSLLLARTRSKDRLLFLVGIFSVLYASRLLLQNGLVSEALGMPGNQLLPWIACLTYLVAIPYAWFAYDLFGKGWNGALRLWLWAQIAFAVVAVPISFLSREHWADVLNDLIIVCGTVLLLLHVLLKRDGASSFATSLKWPLIFFGVLVILNNRGFRPGGADVEPIGFLVLLGGLGVTSARRALANERKLIDVEKELATARRIQAAIIPDTPPELLSLRIATRYQPMTSVAGDFYDFLKTNDHCLTILVADVSGHGVPAALVASMLKVCFAAQQERAGNPAGILAGLNLMLRGSLGGQYITAACAAIDTEAGTVTYAGAGHPPSLLLRSQSGEIVQLAENGLFIGPFPNAAYSNISVPFHRGDKLLLYTDGITEATGPDGQEFGRERLEHFLHATEDSSPAAVVTQLFQHISTPTQQDDLTAVLAQFI